MSFDGTKVVTFSNLHKKALESDLVTKKFELLVFKHLWNNKNFLFFEY